MQHALSLSLKGSGFVNPNPLVGAVIVKNGEIIGEGFHKKFGQAHAEINAINSSAIDVAGATMYVTMEPCNHFGKTPPCTEQIIKEKFSRIVIGMKDPNPNVKGNGIQSLINAGIEVDAGILEKEAKKINEVYSNYIQSGKPFCVLKTAMTLDGKISTYTGDSKWISNKKSREWVHQLRHKYSAIMVGVNTVINDNPMLTDRSENIYKSHPIRIIVDSSGRTPLDANVINSQTAKTVIAVTQKAEDSFISIMQNKGVEIIICPEKDNKVDLQFLVTELGKKGIDSILLEGGSTLNFSALKDKIVHKLYSFISPKLIGGENAYTPVGGAGFKKVDDAITLQIEKIHRFEEDIMVEAYIA